MKMNRREFIGDVALSAAGAMVSGCVGTLGGNPAPRAKIGDIRAMFLGLGHNMWCDWPSAAMGTPEEGAVKLDRPPELVLTCSDEIWRKATDHMAERGVNMLVVDLGEGLVYPSHPELAITGSWSVEKMRTEIARLNAKGIEVVPKLNFSTTHNSWLGDYSHAVSSRLYYRVCEDVIRDCCEIFDSPRFFHIGFDEEYCEHQEKNDRYKYICVRHGEMWWGDFLHIVRTVEDNGARPWAWSDFGWHNKEYFTRCPKSVVQQNWYYDECYGGFDLATNKTDDYCRLKEFTELEEAGFDQVPCGTNWTGWRRGQLGVGADDVMGRLVKYARAVVSKEHLYGFMMAPWRHPTDQAALDFINRGTDLFAKALES